jgi:DNA repair protein RecO (recombination protein O)
MAYQKFEGLILKQTNYQEADRIVTIWTKQEGKIRVLAKSVRLAKSKLAYSLQDISLINFEVTGKKLPLIINTKLLKNFQRLREGLQSSALAIFVKETMLKLTADGQPNEEIFNLLISILGYLNQKPTPKNIFEATLSYAVKLVKFQGFYQYSALRSSLLKKGFSLEGVFTKLETEDLEQLPVLSPDVYKTAEDMVRNMLEYVTERKIKSLDYLNDIK